MDQVLLLFPCTAVDTLPGISGTSLNLTFRCCSNQAYQRLSSTFSTRQISSSWIEIYSCMPSFKFARWPCLWLPMDNKHESVRAQHMLKHLASIEVVKRSPHYVVSMNQAPTYCTFESTETNFVHFACAQSDWHCFCWVKNQLNIA